MHIGEIIKKYRTEHKLTMEEFGKLIGRSKAYISMLEKNKNSRSGREIIPSADTLIAVANVLKITIDDLVKQLDDYSPILLSDTHDIPLQTNSFSSPTIKRGDETSKNLEKMSFGQILYNLRTSRNITQAELANYLKISKSLISMYERNQRKPSFEILEGIADFFNVDMNTLYGMDAATLLKASKKDERDIQKRLQSILDDLDDKADLNFYNGSEEMDDETKELLRISIESSIRLAKERAKKKFTPKKYKKD